MPNHPSQPKPVIGVADQPITVETLNDIWFLVVALVAVVAYCVRVELSVQNCDRRINRIETEVVPALRHDVRELESDFEDSLAEVKKAFSAELQAALESQRDFIAGQTALILEKIHNIKEQTDRQGKELREVGGLLSYQKHHHPD